MIRGFAHIVQGAAAPLADHIWQSTVFALAAACLTLVARRDPAAFRFTIWLAASVKFLLPFALLMHLGHALGMGSTTAPPRNLVAVLETAGQPFGRAHPPLAPRSTWREGSAGVPALLGALWLTGFIAKLMLWRLRWVQVAHMRRAAEPIEQGPEFDCLQSLAAAAGIRPPPMLLSKSRLEPGIFGIFQPVLLWPAGISDALREPEIRAILAHEVWHARRRDNLAAAVQMLIEAAFWFHPLVWWLGSRQMEEREHACDEGALGLGSEPAVYAEGVLKACKFYVESPLPCVAGVNGSNLKKRIRHIMNYKQFTALSAGKKLVISSLALAAIALPVLLGVNASPRAMAQASSASAASGPLHITVTRSSTGGFTLFKHTAEGTSISNATVKALIAMAYSVKDNQLTGGPAWIDQDRFDIVYTGGEPSNSPGSLVSNQALRVVLAQRLHLVIHQETKLGSTFTLVIGEGGAKFQTATPPNLPGTNEPILQVRTLKKDGQGQINITGGPGSLADALSAQLSQPVIDKTGLTGTYSINFHWAADASAESLSGELQQQLGLALISQEGLVETTTVDSVAMPTGS